MLYNIALMDSQDLNLLFIPLLIFLARILDVSIGTLRIIFVSRGMKYLAPIFGFLEVLIWLIALGEIMKNLTNPINYIAYAGGFATGNFVGIYLAGKLSMGMVCVRIITPENADKLLDQFKAKHIGYTVVEAKGSTGEVQLIFTIIKRKDLKYIYELIHKFSPKAFISIEEIQDVEKGIFPQPLSIKDVFRKRILSRLGK